MTSTEETFEGWAILELMGHRRLAGHLRTVTLGGAPMLRLDVPGDGETFLATQYYSASAVYCITPTTEEIARAVARTGVPAPVARWELPAPKETAPPKSDFDPEQEET